MKRLLYVIPIALILYLLLAIAVRVHDSHAARPCHVMVTAGGRTFEGQVTRSYRTSCPFAKNVTRNSLRFIIRSGGSGDGDFFIFAWSPVTRLNYRMHCWAHGDLHSDAGMKVICRGGIGARVSYDAWETY